MENDVEQSLSGANLSERLHHSTITVERTYSASRRTRSLRFERDCRNLSRFGGCSSRRVLSGIESLENEASEASPRGTVPRFRSPECCSTAVGVRNCL